MYYKVFYFQHSVLEIIEMVADYIEKCYLHLACYNGISLSNDVIVPNYARKMSNERNKIEPKAPRQKSITQFRFR